MNYLERWIKQQFGWVFMLLAVLVMTLVSVANREGSAQPESAAAVLKAESDFTPDADATPAPTPLAKEKANTYAVNFPALKPGDTVTVRFLVEGSKSPDPIEMTFSMPTTDTLVQIYQEQFRQAQAGLDQVLKALDADPESVVDTAIYQQNVVGERATLKKLAELIRPILIGRGVNGVIRSKRVKTGA